MCVDGMYVVIMFGWTEQRMSVVLSTHHQISELLALCTLCLSFVIVF